MFVEVKGQVERLVRVYSSIVGLDLSIIDGGDISQRLSRSRMRTGHTTETQRADQCRPEGRETAHGAALHQCTRTDVVVYNRRVRAPCDQRSGGRSSGVSIINDSSRQ